MKQNTMVLVGVTLVIGLVGGFFGGIKYQESKTVLNQGGRMMGNGINQQSQRNRMGGFRPITGEIISSDNTSVTVKLTDGSSKIVLMNDKTQVNKAEKATITDLKKGETVSVFGTQNTDGSVTATNIQLGGPPRQ